MHLHSRNPFFLSGDPLTRASPLASVSGSHTHVPTEALVYRVHLSFVIENTGTPQLVYLGSWMRTAVTLEEISKSSVSFNYSTLSVVGRLRTRTWKTTNPPHLYTTSLYTRMFTSANRCSELQLT
jgi:hypothetical protein